MEFKIKFAIIGLVGLLLASLVILLQVNSSKQVLEQQLNKLSKVESENTVLRKKVEEAQDLAVKVDALRDAVTKLSDEKVVLEKKIEDLNAELERQESDNLQIEGKLKNDNVMFKAKIKALNKEKKMLSEKASAFADQNISLTSKFNELGLLLKNKVAEIEDIKKRVSFAPQDSIVFNEEKKSVELTPIVVRPLASVYTSDKVPFIGKILAINRESAFAVINLGQDLGVKAGDNFLVYRDDKSIASLEVIQIRNLIAACDITKESRTIKVGDAVKLSDQQ